MGDFQHERYSVCRKYDGRQHVDLLHSKEKQLMAKEKEQKQPMAPVGTWAPAVALGWLVPGGGHFLLKRSGRGTLLLVSITAMFLFGLMMRGAMFQPPTGDLL